MLLAFLIVGSCGLALFLKMLGQVNATRAPKDRLGFFWNGRVKNWRILSLHRQLYPNSNLRLLYIGLNVFWILLIVVLAYCYPQR